MGAIGGLLGTSGGINGTGFDAPSSAPITAGTNAQQLQTSYNGAQNSMQAQQALLQALQAQGGLSNQNQVYGQFQGVANGTGPNPAQAMLAQQTGQNVQNQAAMMAGQRGASSNVGLLARQAAQQGAQTQQNAVGQGASLQAQQSLNAINSAGGMANTQAGQQIGATNANAQAQQNEQGILQGANSQTNNSNVAMQGNINSVMGQLTNTQMQGQQGMIGGAMQGIGSMMTDPKMASGGMVHKFADGGMDSAPTVSSQPMSNPSPQPFNLGVQGWDPGAGPQSSAGQFVAPQQAAPAATPPAAATTASAPVPTFAGDGAGASALAAGMSSLVGAAGNSASNMAASAKDAMSSMGGSGGGGGGMAMLAALSQGGSVGNGLKAGGNVPGQAQVPGNSTQNDNVKALLSPGELVVDRETMADKGKAGQAARFLAAVIAQKKKGK